MLTIKYVWLYVIVLAASAGGFGAGMAVSPSNSDIEQALKKQAQEIAAMDCELKPDQTWERVVPKESQSRGF